MEGNLEVKCELEEMEEVKFEPFEMIQVKMETETQVDEHQGNTHNKLPFVCDGILDTGKPKDEECYGGPLNMPSTNGVNMESWRRRDVKILIEGYRENPCLWQVKLDAYKNKNARHAALINIQNSLKKNNLENITVEDIKKKIHTLRGQYKKEKKLIKDSQLSGSYPYDVYQPRLWCYDSLSFIDDDVRQSVSTIDAVYTFPVISSQVATYEENLDVDECSSHAPSLHTPSAPSPIPPAPASTLPSSSPAPTPASSSKKMKLDSYDKIFEAAIKRLSQPREEEDEFKAFGKSIGMQLREINTENPIQAKIAKKIVQDVIFLASINSLNVTSKITSDD